MSVFISSMGFTSRWGCWSFFFNIFFLRFRVFASCLWFSFVVDDIMIGMVKSVYIMIYLLTGGILLSLFERVMGYHSVL